MLLSSCIAYAPQALSDERLHIINNSDKRVYAYFCANYPDTNIIDNNNEIVTFPVQQGNNITFPRCITLSKAGSWDTFFKDKTDDYRLHLFIFDAAVIDNVSWKEIKNRYLILKRLDVSYKELKEKKWDIIFQE